MVDRDGLLVKGMADIAPFQQPFLQEKSVIDGWTLDHPDKVALLAMADHNKHPVFFPLSNPTSRAVEHLRATTGVSHDWLAKAADVLVSRQGYSVWQGQHVATKMLADITAQQAATLAYADAFLFMAAVGVVSLCLIPIIPPTPVVTKR